MKINVRTLEMMENFRRLHDQGYSIEDIAKQYKLSVSTVYTRLQEIADKEGVTKEELLARPHAEHQTYNKKLLPVKEIDPTPFEELFDEVTETLNRLEDNMASEIGCQRKSQSIILKEVGNIENS